MATGDGSITEIKDKDGRSYSPRRWRVRVSYGYDPATGKRQQTSKTVRGTKAQAQAERDRAIRERNSGVSIDAHSITFKEYAQEWHAQRLEAGEHAERTMQSEEHNLKSLYRVLGSQKLRDITPATVEKAIRKLRSNKTRTGGKVSGTTVNSYYRTLKQVLKAAANHDLIARNPCDRVKAPKKDTKEKQTMTAAQVRALHDLLDRLEAEQLEALAGKECRMEALGKRTARESVRGVSGLSKLMAVRLGLATGMRLGEVLALRWSDLNRECSQLKVNQALTINGHLKAPKTKGSRRTICLDSDTAAHLRNWKATQRGALVSLGLEAVRDTPVCCSDVGGYIDSPNFETWFVKWRRAHGFGEFAFHQLRHTHATQLLGAGMDVKTVSTRLGHANAATTLNVYSHAIPGKDEEAAGVFEAIMQPKESGTPEAKAI